MGQPEMFFRLMLFGVLLASTAAQAKPVCLGNCGNVNIPYPFGIGDNCSLNSMFNITCNDSTKPFYGNVEVMNISLDGQMRIMNLVAQDCYDNNNMSVPNGRTFASLSLGKFTISNTQNRFVGIGCDTSATIQGFRGEYEYNTGCMSHSDRLDQVIDGTCSGIGCCQIDIPNGLTNITMRLRSYYNHSRVWSFNPCSYAFVVENPFNFSSNYLRGLQGTNLPMVLDWAVGDERCETAEKDNTTFLCKGNSTCDKSYNGPGYRCICFKGYEGNPYLDGNCTDIDECKDPGNGCEKICVNELGSYSCSCPKGYYGDGIKHGKGCIPNQLQVIQVALGVGICFVALLVGGSSLYMLLKKRKLIKLKEKFFRQNGGLMLQQHLNGRDVSTDSAKIFTAEELEKATNRYDEDRIIGRGGYGTVYKGFLTDNSVVAIKKSKIVDQSQIEQFINEVVVLSQIRHRNVVKLLGCCLETEVPLLVYEFVTNGTLFDHIHNESKASAISWEIRLRIAAETAGVLSYLHSAASTSIIHRDVKSTNILLDDNYTAKVSDFGASRLVPIDETQLSTMVQGTLGYLDPEYMHTSQLTEKSDVYSFGVVLVELLTGKKALAFDRPEAERSLAMFFLSLLKKNRLFDILENHIVNDGNKEQLKEVAMLARRCLKIKGEDRPTMKEVAMELEGLRMMEKHPWVNTGFNPEETESLLNVTSSDTYSDGVSSSTTTGGYDSLRNHVILAIDDGR